MSEETFGTKIKLGAEIFFFYTSFIGFGYTQIFGTWIFLHFYLWNVHRKRCFGRREIGKSFAQIENWLVSKTNVIIKTLFYGQAVPENVV